MNPAPAAAGPSVGVRPVGEARPNTPLEPSGVVGVPVCQPDPAELPGSAGGRIAERLIALALAAWVLFNPPMMRVFGRSESVFGLPLMYVYVFLAWGGVIAITARLLDGRDHH